MTAGRVRRAVAVGVGAALLALVGGPALGTGTAHAATSGGPVILGGDDLTDHGSYDGGSRTNNDGWVYVEKAIANISARVTASHDGSIAALGSTDPGFDPAQSYFGDAGAAIASAARKASLTVHYYPDDAAIDGFFTSLRAGKVHPKIIWIAGNGASNDLGSNGGATALAGNATSIGDFVNGGGGLMSHGTEYGWLGGLLPGARGDGCGFGASGDLRLTPTGKSAFPGLTEGQVNAGPWHACFDGDIGNLRVLVSSTTVTDAKGNPGRVVIGGAGVVLPGSINLDPPTSTKAAGGSVTLTATVRDDAGKVRSGVPVHFAVTAGPNAGKTKNGTTGAAGTTPFAYSDTGGAGTDTVEASFVDPSGATQTATATVTWQGSTASTATAKGTVTSYSGGPAWTFDVSVAAPGSGSASLTNPRGRTFTSSGISGLSISGAIATFTATGSFGTDPGWTLTAKLTDGSPDRVVFDLSKGSTTKHIGGALSTGSVVVTP